MRLRTVAAAMVISTLAATPVFAQTPIQEPGMLSFYYPNRDGLNGGVSLGDHGVDHHTMHRFGRYWSGYSLYAYDPDCNDFFFRHPDYQWQPSCN